MAPAPDAPVPEPLLLSMREVARLLGVSRETVYNLAGRGLIVSRKVGTRRMFVTRSVRDYVDRLVEDGP